MSKLKEAPQHLRSYLCHGVDLHWEGTGDAEGICPLCNGDRFHVSQDTGMFHCKHCGEKGNNYTFVTRLWEESLEANGEIGYDTLSERRRIPVSVLQQWGWVCSLTTGDWLLPTYNGKGKINNLYRWSFFAHKNKHLLIGTAEMDRGLFGMNLWKKNCPEVYLTEGPWDAMLLRYLLGKRRLSANVLGVPGCESGLKNIWLPLFSGKVVNILFDSDHPRKLKNGTTAPPSGWKGMERTVKSLRAANRPPQEIRVIHWGGDGYDPALPSGYDLRDFLLAGVG